MKRYLLVLAILISPLILADDDDDDDDGKRSNISQLPAPVQQTIREYKTEGPLKEVKARRGDSGTVYDVKFEKGSEREIVVDSDGRILSETVGGKRKNASVKRKGNRDEARGDRPIGRNPTASAKPIPPIAAPGTRPDGVVVIALRDAPNVVEKAAEQNVRQLGKIDSVRAETRKGRTLYHVRFERGSLSFAPDAATVDRDLYWNTSR